MAKKYSNKGGVKQNLQELKYAIIDASKGFPFFVITANSDTKLINKLTVQEQEHIERFAEKNNALTLLDSVHSNFKINNSIPKDDVPDDFLEKSYKTLNQLSNAIQVLLPLLAPSHRRNLQKIHNCALNARRDFLYQELEKLSSGNPTSHLATAIRTDILRLAETGKDDDIVSAILGKLDTNPNLKNVLAYPSVEIQSALNKNRSYFNKKDTRTGQNAQEAMALDTLESKEDIVGKKFIEIYKQMPSNSKKLAVAKCIIKSSFSTADDFIALLNDKSSDLHKALRSKGIDKTIFCKESATWEKIEKEILNPPPKGFGQDNS